MATLTQNPRFAADTRSRRHEGNGLRSQRQPSRVNVGEQERNVSMAAGAILAVQGVSRGSIPGLIGAAVGGYLIYRGATGQCPVSQALGWDTHHTDGRAPADEITEKGIHVEQSMLVGRPASDLYGYWRDFQNLPRIMTHLVSVEKIDERRWRWTATAPAIAGKQVEWEAELTADEPDSRIAWRSLPGSDVDPIGEVRFEKAPGDRGTYVHATMSYVPPAGKLGHLIAWLFDETPQRKMRDDLRNFKRLMETGEILTTAGQSRGTCLGTGKRQEKL
jgi:uncharacterized membrane protein